MTFGRVRISFNDTAIYYFEIRHFFSLGFYFLLMT
jgi:hypothetical protein